MRIAVLLKLIPHPNSARLDEVSLRLVRSGPAMINPTDEVALETAVRLKEAHGGDVTAFSMTPVEQPALFRWALACGADRIYVVQDAAFANADVFVTAAVLRRAIERYLPDFDLMLGGDRSADGQTGQLGPTLSEMLSLAHVSAVRRVQRCNARSISVERKVHGGYEIVECVLPALVTVLQQVNAPRYPTVTSRFAAFRQFRSDVLVVSAPELGLIGDALPTPKACVTRVGRPKPRGYQKIDEKLSASDRLRMMLSGGTPAAASSESEQRRDRVIIRDQAPRPAAESLLSAMIKRGIDVR